MVKVLRYGWSQVRQVGQRVIVDIASYERAIVVFINKKASHQRPELIRRTEIRQRGPIRAQMLVIVVVTALTRWTSQC